MFNVLQHTTKLYPSTYITKINFILPQGEIFSKTLAYDFLVTFTMTLENSLQPTYIHPYIHTIIVEYWSIRFSIHRKTNNNKFFFVFSNTTNVAIVKQFLYNFTAQLVVCFFGGV